MHDLYAACISAEYEKGLPQARGLVGITAPDAGGAQVGWVGVVTTTGRVVVVTVPPVPPVPDELPLEPWEPPPLLP